MEVYKKLHNDLKEIVENNIYKSNKEDYKQLLSLQENIPDWLISQRFKTEFYIEAQKELEAHCPCYKFNINKIYELYIDIKDKYGDCKYNYKTDCLDMGWLDNEEDYDDITMNDTIDIITLNTNTYELDYHLYGQSLESVRLAFYEYIYNNVNSIEKAEAFCLKMGINCFQVCQLYQEMFNQMYYNEAIFYFIYHIVFEEILDRINRTELNLNIDSD